MKLAMLNAKMRAGVFADLQRRIDERAAAGASIIGLHIGDTHLSPPDDARWKNLAAEVDADYMYKYGATAAIPAFREALAAHVSHARHVEGIGADNVIVGAGGTHALFCVAKAVLDPGEEVIAFAPYWPLAHGIFTSTGAKVVEVSVSQRAYTEPDLDVTPLLEAHLTPQTKAIYFVSPNNPDGKILSRAQLMQIASFAEAHDLFVFADEVYADIVYDGTFTSFGSLHNMISRSALVYSFSKSHALAGHRVGYVVAPKDVIGAARRVSVHTVFNVPAAMQRSALVALTHGTAFQARAKEAYLEARNATCAALAKIPGASFFVPEGATYVFLDFAKLLDGRPLSALLERAIDEGVLLAPGEGFGAAFTTSARLCFSSVPEDELARGLTALLRAMRSM